jgi:hypothetical protein
MLVEIALQSKGHLTIDTVLITPSVLKYMSFSLPEKSNTFNFDQIYIKQILTFIIHN